MWEVGVMTSLVMTFCKGVNDIHSTVRGGALKYKGTFKNVQCPKSVYQEGASCTLIVCTK